MKYKIGVDLTYIMEDEVSGIKKYAEEIIDGLTKYENKCEILIFVNDNLEEYYVKRFQNCKVISIKFLLRNIRFVRRINRTKLIKNKKGNIIRQENCDIIIYPYINDISLFIEEQEKIVSILDIIPLDEIEDKDSKEYKRIKKENVELMNKSKYIVTISEYSKKRLMEINPEYKGKIIVIPSPVAKPKESNKNVSEILNVNKKYILSINSFFKHKNQITLVKAFNLIKDKIQDNLVLVGRPELSSNDSGYNDVMDYIDKNNLKDRVTILSYISDEDRDCLLYNADLFVTTSLMEGFGRTPVEASLCKVPVISTKETSLPEATMHEAFYYENATDEVELSKKILEVLENKPSKERLDEIAKKLEEEYKEEKIAIQYFNLIDEILKTKNFE